MPIKKYPQDVIEYIRGHAYGLTCRELTELFNKTELAAEKGITFTPEKMKAFLNNYRISLGGHKKGKAQYSKKYTKEVVDFIRENVRGRSTQELAGMVRERFGPQFTDDNIRCFKKNHKITSGIDARFRKGVIPPNKGRKGYCSPGCEVSWFKKGNLPKNTLPIGSEIVDADGYHKIKVGNPNYWIFVHRLIWMKEHGDIPENGMITFLDGDKDNMDPSNICMITNAENLELHRSKLRSEDPELTKAGVQVARLKIRIREKEKEEK